MKQSFINEPSVIRSSAAAFLLAGILSLGAGLSASRAADYTFIVDEGSFVDVESWDPQPIDPPANDKRYITNDGIANFSDDDVLSINELHLGMGSLVMAGGSLTTGQNGGWARIGDYEGNGNAASVASLTMSGSASLSALQPIYFAYGSSSVADSATATVELSGNASISGTNLFVVGMSGGSATVKLTGDSSVSSGGQFTIGKGGGTGKVTLSDNATLTVDGDRVWIGGEQSAGSTGELALSGEAQMFYNGTSQYGFTIGDGDTTGTLTLSGSSSLTSTSSSPLLLVNGDGPNVGTATVTVGGTASVLDFAGQIVVGQRGAEGSTATLNVNSGGTVKAAYVVVGGDSNTTASGVNGTINLNGGTLETAFVTKGLSDSDATRNVLNANGGTLRATGDEGDFIQNGLTVNVQSGGLKIDTQAFEVGIATDLAGEGGLTKLGEGRLSVFGALTYAGATTVSEGILSIDGGSLENSASLSVASGAGLELTGEFSLNDAIVLSLASGASVDLDFTGTEAVEKLSINGLFVEAGTYSLADLQELGGGVTFTGSSDANLTVMAVPEPSVVALALAGLLGALAVSRSGMRAGRAVA